MGKQALALAALLCAAVAGPGQIQPPDQVKGDIVARLTVKVADQPAGPGLAAATATVTVTGPITLQMEPARLGETVSAWASTSNFFGLLEGDRLTLTERIALKQTKAGQVALPSIAVRFRSDDSSAWEEAKWTDLSTLRDGLGPDETPTLPVWRAPRWFWPAVVGAVVLPLAVLCAWRLTRPRPIAQPTPRQWALRQLAELEAGIGQQGSEWYHTRLAYIIRRFLAERYGLPAEQRTTAEFLAAASRTPELSGEQCEVLGGFLERCDLAKFAPVSTSAEECRQTTALARCLVDSTSEPVGQVR